jgi:hypothetical protein
MPSKIIQDIWILTDGGMVVFSRVYDENVDEQLFGALMTALNSFAEEISKGGLSNFELSKKRFTILKKNSFIFIANSDNKFKPKKVLQELDTVINKFFTLYPEDILKEWDNDLSLFSNFEVEIKESLDDPIKKMQKAFW